MMAVLKFLLKKSLTLNHRSYLGKGAIIPPNPPPPKAQTPKSPRQKSYEFSWTSQPSEAVLPKAAVDVNAFGAGGTKGIFEVSKGLLGFSVLG